MHSRSSTLSAAGLSERLTAIGFGELRWTSRALLDANQQGESAMSVSRLQGRISSRIRCTGLAAGLLLILWMNAGCSGPVMAQAIQIRAGAIQIQGGPTTSAGSGSPSLFLPNRKLAQRLRQASQLIEREDYARGLPLVQGVIDDLDDSEDAFFNPDDSVRTHFLSLKAATRKLIEGLPRAGLRSYQLQYGTTAEAELKAAVASGDLKQLARVERRFFGTAAGIEASNRLGNILLDRNQPLAAALQFERLQRSPLLRQSDVPSLYLKAAVCWVQAGMPEQARETLAELVERMPEARVTVAGREVAVARDSDSALDWLYQTVRIRPQSLPNQNPGDWRMFRGNPGRTGTVGEVSPIGIVAWRHRSLPMIFYEGMEEESAALIGVESRLQQLKAGTFENLITMPAAHPLVVGDTIVFRTLGTLKTVDARSGDLIWEAVAPDPAFDKLLDRSENGVAANGMPRNGFNLDMFIAQRAWRDATAGQLSTNGAQVFAIDDLGYSSASISSRGVPTVGNGTNHNTLVAYHVDGGKLAWQIGGPSDDPQETYGNHFFLGAPLPIGGQLYVLAEVREEIRLLSLSPARVQESPERWRIELQWSQQLVAPNEQTAAESRRPMAGLTPSYARGVLVCPTAAGATIAFDLATRQLLWGYQYQTQQQDFSNQLPMAFRAANMPTPISLPTDEDEGRWIDSSVTIVGDSAILTPRDSGEMHCLDLREGHVRWKRPRGQAMFVAGVHQDSLILVGRSHMEALRLSDGQPTWTESAIIGPPSGRGLQVADRYHVPLESGEIATVDLATGRILIRSSTRSGHVPGNLLAVGDRLISQTENEIVGFVPLGELRSRLAQQGADGGADQAETLALRGELALASGNVEQGLSDLRAALALLKPSQEESRILPAKEPPSEPPPGANKPDDSQSDNPQSDDGQPDAAESTADSANSNSPDEGQASGEPGTVETAPRSLPRRVRNLLRESLLEGLRVDFARYKQNIDEIESLIDSDPDRFRFRRLIADGLLSEQQYREAFFELSRISEMASANHMVTTSFNREVRIDRWVAQRSRSLWLAADEKLHSEMNEHLTNRLRQSLDAQEFEQAESFLSCFPWGQASGNARLELARHYLESDRQSEATRHLFRLARRSDDELALSATVLLAELAAARADRQLAGSLITEIESRWAADRRFEDESIEDLVERLRRSLGVESPALPAWPAGTAQVQVRQRVLPLNQTTPIPVRGDRGPYADRTFRLNSTRQGIVAIDGQGRTEWTFPLELAGATYRHSTSENAVQVHDNLVAVQLQRYFVVLDQLSGGDAPRMLWRGFLSDPNSIHAGRVAVQGVFIRGGRQVVVTSNQGPQGTLGPFSHSAIVYQNGENLIAADTLDGRMLWQLSMVPVGSQLFGTTETICVRPPDSTSILVLDGLDGSLIRTVSLPDHDQLSELSGTALLLRRERDGQSVWEVLDAATGQIVVRAETDRATQSTAFDGRYLALYEQSGNLRLLDYTTGQDVLNVKLPATTELTSIFARSSSRQFLIAVNRKSEQPFINPILSQSNLQSTMNGDLHALDRQSGKLLWTATVADQQVDLEQPRDLPLLVFTTRRVQVIQPGRSSLQSRFGAVILDLRDGNTLFERTGPVSMDPYQIEPGTDASSIRVDFSKETAAVSFTEPE